MLHDRHHECRLIRERLEEGSPRHDRRRAGRDTFDARRAGLAVDRRQFAEDRAFLDVAEAHPPAAQRVDVDARLSGEQEQHIERPVFLTDDELARRKRLAMTGAAHRRESVIAQSTEKFNAL